METNEYIGMAIAAVVMLLATAQLAYALGHHNATRRARQLADPRVNGVLDYENARRPKTIKAKRKTIRRGHSVGTVVAHGVRVPSFV